MAIQKEKQLQSEIRLLNQTMFRNESFERNYKVIDMTSDRVSLHTIALLKNDKNGFELSKYRAVM